MDQLDLARLQFAATSIYHFFFVPVTMGLAILVAVLHTRWHRSGDPDLLRLTKFFGTLMLLSIAVGVVTGLVQEFQFGLDWSAYSRFVGREDLVAGGAGLRRAPGRGAAGGRSRGVHRAVRVVRVVGGQRLVLRVGDVTGGGVQDGGFGGLNGPVGYAQ